MLSLVIALNCRCSAIARAAAALTKNCRAIFGSMWFLPAFKCVWWIPANVTDGYQPFMIRPACDWWAMLSLVIAQNCSWPAIARGAATLTKTCLSFVVSFQVSSELHILLLFCYAVGHFPLSWHWGLVLRASRISIVLKACDPGSIPGWVIWLRYPFCTFPALFFVISVNVAYDGAVLGYTARRIIILMLFGWELLLPHQAFLHCDLVVVLESIVCNGWLEHIFIWIHNVYVYVV